MRLISFQSREVIWWDHRILCLNYRTHRNLYRTHQNLYNRALKMWVIVNSCSSKWCIIYRLWCCFALCLLALKKKIQQDYGLNFHNIKYNRDVSPNKISHVVYIYKPKLIKWAIFSPETGKFYSLRSAAELSFHGNIQFLCGKNAISKRDTMCNINFQWIHRGSLNTIPPLVRL